MIKRATGEKNQAVSQKFIGPLICCPKQIPFPISPFHFFLPLAAAFVTLFYAVPLFCLKPTDLQTQKQFFFFLFSLLCLEVSIYPSPPLWGSLCLSLVSPLRCIVSAVSVTTVIAAVTSRVENKVVLCSWRHKRHKRKEPKPNRKDSKRRN